MSISSPAIVIPKADIGVLMSAPMVLATLAGTKTQTRRPLYVPTKNIDSARFDSRYPPPAASPGDGKVWTLSKWFDVKVGRRLWVRENLRVRTGHRSWEYVAGNSLIEIDSKYHDRVLAMVSWAHHMERDYCPSIHMPRWACRAELETTADVQVERLQGISAFDALQEGLEQCWDLPTRQDNPVCFATAVQLYRELWERINGAIGPISWDANPWVCVISFQRIKA